MQSDEAVERVELSVAETSYPVKMHCHSGFVCTESTLYVHYITLHYITLHYNTVQNPPVQCVASVYMHHDCLTSGLFDIVLLSSSLEVCTCKVECVNR